ncbi:MAG: FtsB family cell division protein [Bacteroidota bacterium]
MNKQLFNPLRWRKSFLAIILAIFLLVWFGFLDTYSIWTRYQLAERKDELKAKTEQLNKETQLLQQKVHQLQTDSSLIERIAREEYGMKRKGETIYRIKGKKE